MRTWDYFFPDVLPDVLGCPEPTAERAIQNAAREFCERSRLWTVDLPAIQTAGLQSAYPIVYEEDAEGVLLVHATLDGRDIDLEVRDETSAGERRRGASGGERVTSPDMVNVVLMPTPAADVSGRSLVLTAVCMPSELALGMPDRYADKWRAAISSGALRRLLNMNQVKWANPALAREKAGEFEAAIRNARSKAWRGNTNRAPRNVTHWY